MPPHRLRRTLTAGLATGLLAGLAALVAITSVDAAPRKPAGASPGARDRSAVVTYWTPGRVARAIPREVAPDRSPAFRPEATRASKPGGGGSGTTTTVTGAQWVGGGLVKSTVGKVLFTMAGVDYVCSGTVVEDSSTTTSLILTAGHCVYDEAGSGFASNWMFVPDYENGGSITTGPDGSASFSCDTTPHGCWTASALVTTSAWAGGGGSLSGFNHDYAFAVVGPGGKTGASGLQLDAVAGRQTIAFNRAHPTQVYAFGYPQASPYDGSKLIHCAGKDIADSWGGTTDFGVTCTMTGGSSGGGWFVDFDPATGTGKLNSVNSFKYTSGKFTKYMFGPYFGSYAQKTYLAAGAAVADTLVTP